jgi:two-component system, OmpR family, heavy metal sensor histidine kinase CusS
MLSKRTEPRSIATQLVLLFTVCAMLLLSCSLGLFYWIVVRHALEEDAVVFADKVDTLQRDFEKRGGATAPAFEIDASRGSPFYVRVLDTSGATVKQTPGMENLPPSIFPPAGSREIAKPIEYRIGGHLYSLTAWHALGPDQSLATVGDQFFTLQIAQDRSADEEFQKQFGTLLAFVLGLGVMASALIAVTVTRRGLRPLGQMRRALERVELAHLNERIDPGRWPSELRPLAASFDDMLGRLEDSFTRLSQFSADLAHELRTPIGNMLGEAQVALTRERRPEEYRAVIESAAAECERLSGIIDNLLFLARAESAEQQVNRSVFNGRAAIDKIASFYEESAEDADIKISRAGDAEVFADPLLFNRAVGNLVENALRFTPAGGEIRISLRQSQNGSEISVRDSGSGIAPEHLPRVFDRFYRGDPSRSSAGTGLGLALVKSIVDLHSGSVTIESSVGHGTTVTLTFPDKA